MSEPTRIILIVLGVLLVLAALPFLFMGSMMAAMMGGMMSGGMTWGMGAFAMLLLLGGAALVVVGLRR